MSKVEEKIHEVYAGALTNANLASKVKAALASVGYDESTTLLASSLCCDEVNRELEKELAQIYGDNFSMGGLAGFAFGGITSFGAMAHHIPTGGNCVIIYGPHVGIDADGVVGKVNRRGRETSGACCGSATAACGYVESVMNGGEKAGVPEDFIDAQQFWVGNELLKHGERLQKAPEVATELPFALFDCQNEVMRKIVSAAAKETHGGKIALIGGIQINTPSGHSDYFLVKCFDIIDSNGNKTHDLISKLV